MCDTISSDSYLCQANGFYQSKGFSKYIPPAYTYLESKFWEAIKSSDKQDNIEVAEWKRQGWTYHSKGWFRLQAGQATS
jgi:CDP-diacylglycerol--glycerol-3-phosphate 3-phosphatidyltransferase